MNNNLDCPQDDSLQLKLISHACAILQCNHSSLIFDPWFSGKIFNNGWELKNEVDINSISVHDINYVYISHEHPDHFHIPSLLAMNKLWNPTFLLQKTRDRRVYRFIRDVLGNEVIELSDGIELSLSNQMSIRIYSHGHLDSFSLVRLGQCNILNLNDCVLKSEESLLRLRNKLPAGTNIDILMSQYSFASFQGNKDEDCQLSSAAHQHLEWLRQREDFFKPLMFIPFASGINWCSPENSYLNDFSVNYVDAVKVLKKSLAPRDDSPTYVKDVIVYKDSSCLVPRSSCISLAANPSDEYAQVLNSVDLHQELTALFSKLQEVRCILNKKNFYCAIPLMRLAGYLGFLKRVKINLYSGGVKFCSVFLHPGLILSFQSPSSRYQSQSISEIEMSLDSLLFCFVNQFGAETLWVNSRFAILKGSPKDFFKHFYLSILSNQGFYFPFGLIKFVWQRVIAPRIIF